MPGKVVLAYSGGLDTSICIPLLRERFDYDDVVTVAVDVGQPRAELKDCERRARNLADLHFTVDAREEFVSDYVFNSIRANGCFEGYVLGTALARPLIARKCVEIAREVGADGLAHGCTGRGNDQLRFDAVFAATDLPIIAPIRELELTREWEIDYARDHDIEVPVTKEKPWSIDENLWSRSIEGGSIEDPSTAPPPDAYTWTCNPSDTPDRADEIDVGFEEGVPVSLDGELLKGQNIISRLNEIGGKHGVGRTDMVEDRVLGLKSRELYEHPAATILLTAHKDLEQLTLTREQLRFKAGLDAVWSELAYRGLVEEPLFEDLNAFLESNQQVVSGNVRLRLFKCLVSVVSRSSDNSLIAPEMVSFDSDEFSQKDGEGFARLHSLQTRLHHRRFKR